MNAKLIAKSDFGPVVLIWADLDGNPKIARVLLSRPEVSAVEAAGELYPGSRPGSCREIDAVVADIRGFLDGGSVVFDLAVADLASRPAFQRSVLRAEHGIPRGRVSTYGLIARHLGDPRAARAVGNALATNPFPIIVPCHRAVRSDGGLGGFQGGPAMKRALLEREGIAFDRAGRVAAPRFHYS